MSKTGNEEKIMSRTWRERQLRGCRAYRYVGTYCKYLQVVTETRHLLTSDQAQQCQYNILHDDNMPRAVLRMYGPPQCQRIKLNGQQSTVTITSYYSYLQVCCRQVLPIIKFRKLQKARPIEIGVWSRNCTQQASAEILKSSLLRSAHLFDSLKLLLDYLYLPTQWGVDKYTVHVVSIFHNFNSNEHFYEQVGYLCTFSLVLLKVFSFLFC